MMTIESMSCMGLWTGFLGMSMVLLSVNRLCSGLLNINNSDKRKTRLFLRGKWYVHFLCMIYADDIG